MGALRAAAFWRSGVSEMDNKRLENALVENPISVRRGRSARVCTCSQCLVLATTHRPCPHRVCATTTASRKTAVDRRLLSHTLISSHYRVKRIKLYLAARGEGRELLLGFGIFWPIVRTIGKKEEGRHVSFIRLPGGPVHLLRFMWVRLCLVRAFVRVSLYSLHPSQPGRGSNSNACST